MCAALPAGTPQAWRPGFQWTLAPLCTAGSWPPRWQVTATGAWDFVALWIGLVVSVSSYYLAGSLVELGMDWVQGVLTVLLGNSITLAGMVGMAYQARGGCTLCLVLRVPMWC